MAGLPRNGQRQHGLQAPLDPHQVGTFVVITLFAVTCYSLFVPIIISDVARGVLVGIYSALLAIVLYLAYATTQSDPSDAGLKGSLDGELFCSMCEVNVSSSAKHCRACNRCVEGFDHHCKWLNNCIGHSNYRSFFLLVSATVTLLTLQLAWGIWLVTVSFTQKALYQLRALSVYGSSFSYVGWQVGLFLLIVLLAATICMLGELLVFHMVLISKDLTTFEYITAQREIQMNTQQLPGTGMGARSALCRNNRVADEAMLANVDVPKQRVKVGINPCKACAMPAPEHKHEQQASSSRR
uniref:S-acyltransferase n=1 Tax=Chlamydomonas euryale TaxID=1486919 RepID=A0A7R9VX56_9CHLO|mmetsp:Transcript_604/g.1652  ORF Transcript_604/g.1652 Transcript_604/m.1652 type:complete len:297 (+) Transcript_604:569-1459(+)